MKKNVYSLIATLGLVVTNITMVTSCFIGLYEPELPKDE